MLCGIDNNQFCNLIDLENNNIVYYVTINNFFNNDDNDDYISQYYAILNLNQNNKILLSHLENDQDYYIALSILYLTKDNIFSLQNEYDYRKEYDIDSFQKDEISCFITKQNYIECLIVYNDEIKVEIYNDSLNYLNDITLVNVSGNIPYALSIHLKSEIGVFAYCLKDNEDENDLSPIYIQIKELYFRNPDYAFKDIIRGENIFEITISEDYSIFWCIFDSLVSLIQLSENKFSLAYAGDYIIIVIFNLYGDNEDSLLIRYYKIDIAEYNINFPRDLTLFKFNSFLGIGFAPNLITEDEEDISRGVFAIFGYSSKKQITFFYLNSPKAKFNKNKRNFKFFYFLKEHPTLKFFHFILIKN